MKAIAYNVQAQEKEMLVRANAKRFKLTLISNGLNADTSTFSDGKEAVIISAQDQLGAALLTILKKKGVRKIISRSVDTHHIDLRAAEQLGLEIHHLKSPAGLQESAWEIIELLST